MGRKNVIDGNASGILDRYRLGIQKVGITLQSYIKLCDYSFNSFLILPAF